jgi:hypothetical protein
MKMWSLELHIFTTALIIKLIALPSAGRLAFCHEFFFFFHTIKFVHKKKYANESDDWWCGFICVNFEGLFELLVIGIGDDLG